MIGGRPRSARTRLGSWYWATNAIALLAAGLLSDTIRVRKPFMVVRAILSLVGVALFATATTDASTSYHTFALYFVLMSAGAGIAYVTWMAAFTETVEKHNPAATATGLAVWGWIIRIVVTVSFAILPAVVPATSTPVDQGPHVARIVATYPTQVRVLKTVDATTLATLARKPSDKAAQARAVSELSGVPRPSRPMRPGPRSPAPNATTRASGRPGGGCASPASSCSSRSCSCRRDTGTRAKRVRTSSRTSRWSSRSSRVCRRLAPPQAWLPR
jgi:hypothetical protein